MYHVAGLGSFASLFATVASQVSPVTLLVRESQAARDLVQAARIKNKSSQIASRIIVQHAERPPIPGRIRRPITSGTLSSHTLGIEFLSSPYQGVAEAQFPPKNRSYVRKIDLNVSSAPISTLVLAGIRPVTVLSTIDLVKKRLSADSTIVLFQHANGIGNFQEVVRQKFPDVESRPSFVIGCSTHSTRAQRHDRARLSAIWDYRGSMPFGVIPNQAIVNQLKDSSPLLDVNTAVQLKLDDLPDIPEAASLKTTLKQMLNMRVLSTAWLSLGLLQVRQLQLVVLSSIVQSLTTLLDIPASTMLKNPPARKLIDEICDEAAQVFAAHEAAGKILTASPELAAQAPVFTKLVPDQEEGEVRSPGRPLSKETLLRWVTSYLDKCQERTMVVENQARFENLYLGEQYRIESDVEYTNRYITRLGEQHGIPTPTNDYVASMLEMQFYSTIQLRNDKSRRKAGRPRVVRGSETRLAS